VTERIDQCVNVSASFTPDPNRPPPMKVPPKDLADKYSGLTFESHQRTWFELLPWMHESVSKASAAGSVVLRSGESVRSRCRLIRRRRAQQQALHRSAARHAAAEKPCGDDSGVVEHQHIPGHEY